MTVEEQIIKQLFNETLNAILKMSKTPLNYWAEFAVDIPLGVVLIYEGLYHNKPGPVAALLTIFLGFFLFSFISSLAVSWTGGVSGSESPGASRESVGLRFAPLLLTCLDVAGNNGHMHFGYACELCIFTDRYHNFRLCHLWAEPFYHPPPPFSTGFCPRLGSQSSYPSLSHRH
jgi:hypothetical protein